MAKRVKQPAAGGSGGKGRSPEKAAQQKAAQPARSTALAPRRESSAAMREPFGFMRRFADDMERLLQDFRQGTSSLLPRLHFPLEVSDEAGEWLPAVDVTERGGKLVVRADLPGLTKKDVQVEVTEDTLRIRGERRQEREEKRKDFYRSERSYGSFYREIPLPDGTDPEKAMASFRDGVLEVTFPAPPKPAKGRQVPIAEA
jgi:HSP20 family protein